MSSVEKETEASWFKLNDYEQTSRARFEELPERDLGDRPWTDEDHENVRRMVQQMTGRLARIEERLDVIYRITHNTLKEIKQLAFVAFAVAIAIFLASLWH
ncbi:hypothetical protein [Rhodanobacter sp. B04]|uniref:hypothetical protein n=1 Tax=Rhodanobacter sp. B04 TaxID=1945860 RepID=UPI0011154BF5|nr:hypothetical protein [Rhodanobacter sp. B04]